MVVYFERGVVVPRTVCELNDRSSPNILQYPLSFRYHSSNELCGNVLCMRGTPEYLISIPGVMKLRVEG